MCRDIGRGIKIDKEQKMRVLFAGGGTGGHINPAISIADYIKDRDKNFQALFIGTKRGLETKLVPKAGYDIEYIDICGFDRKNLLKNFSVLKKLSQSKKRCREIIKEFKPDAVVLTGGYVSGPVAMAAHKMGVGAIIHEQNVYPGLTVKGSIKYVDYVAVSFSETIEYIKNKEKCVLTGNPVRTQIIDAKKELARKELGLSDKPFVLIFGGSLGAQKINENVVKILKKISKDNKIQLLFGTGERNFDEIMQQIKDISLSDDIKIVPYIDNMHLAMAAADVVVSRSGAITVSEIAVLGKPSILIPSPNVVRNHQEQNARALEKVGACKVLVESELNENSLYNAINSLANDKKTQKNMSENLKKVACPDALDRLYELVKKISKNK